MLKRFLKGFKKVLKASGGYTLIEVAAVVAVSATLAAVVIPVVMEKLKDSKKVAALEDCRAISEALVTFYKDVGEFPAMASPTDSEPGTLQLLKSGKSINTTPNYTSWNITVGKDEWLSDHLFSYGQDGQNYHVWNGPYCKDLTKKVDPWGNSYLVFVKGMVVEQDPAGIPEYGWILSAGRNEVVDTLVTSYVLSDDDIGIMFYSNQIKQGN